MKGKGKAKNHHTPLHRMQPCHKFHLVVAELGPQPGCVDRAGDDAVHGNAARGELLRERARELLNGAARRADKNVRGQDSRLLGRHMGEKDDTAACGYVISKLE